jgi:hypothetical protein
VLENVGYAMTWVPPKLVSYSTTIVTRFSVSWTWDPLPDPQTPQSDEAGVGLGEGVIAAAVVVPLVVLAAVLAAWIGYRRGLNCR